MAVGHLAKDLEGEFEVGACVRRCHAEAEPCRTLRNCWKQDRSGQDTVITKPSGEERSGHFVLQNNRYDRRLGEAGVIAQVLQAATQETGVLLDSCHTLRLQ